MFQVLNRLEIIQHHLHQQSQFLRLRQGFLNLQGGVGNLKKSPIDQSTDKCQQGYRNQQFKQRKGFSTD